MSTLITILHVIVCLFLMLTVLLQSGKGGGMGGAFGGGNAGTVFGGSGASSFLRKLTAGAATIFMLDVDDARVHREPQLGDALEKFGEQQAKLASREGSGEGEGAERRGLRLGIAARPLRRPWAPPARRIEPCSQRARPTARPAARRRSSSASPDAAADARRFRPAPTRPTPPAAAATRRPRRRPRLRRCDPQQRPPAADSRRCQRPSPPIAKPDRAGQAADAPAGDAETTPAERSAQPAEPSRSPRAVASRDDIAPISATVRHAVRQVPRASATTSSSSICARATAPTRRRVQDPAMVIALCDRQFGVGGDGVLAILPSATGADARMRVLNATAARPRCAATASAASPRSSHDRGGVAKHELAIDTGAGRLACAIERATVARRSPSRWARRGCRAARSR